MVNEMYQMTSINMTDALTEESSQEASVFDETELIGSPNTDMVAAQLASAGLPTDFFLRMIDFFSVYFQCQIKTVWTLAHLINLGPLTNSSSICCGHCGFMILVASSCQCHCQDSRHSS